MDQGVKGVDHGLKGVDQGGGEVDHVVEEVHSRGYIFADDETLGPDPGRCYNSEEFFEEVGNGGKDENSGANGRHR